MQAGRMALVELWLGTPLMSDKYLIVGLGNPGKQYEATRHNVGFMAVEAFARRAGISGKTENKFNAIVGTGKYRGFSLIVAQPLTFMNLSGEAVAKLVKYYDIEPERLLVIYDEAALPFGKIRLRPSGSDAGQKGMKSIIQCLGGNNQIPRLRIGIGGPPAKMAMPDYVLGKFDEQERNDLPRVLDAAMDAVDVWLEQGMEAAMTHYNGSSVLPE
jgi:PTH1 family peptidyl-tRNA hydrolase